MSPTSLVGQKTTTSVKGRDPKIMGMPLKISELISHFDVSYLARGSVHDAAHIRKTKTYIRKAFETQMNQGGYTCVEIISPCPTNWHLTPLQAVDRIEKEVLEYYPVGEIKGGAR